MDSKSSIFIRSCDFVIAALYTSPYESLCVLESSVAFFVIRNSLINYIPVFVNLNPLELSCDHSKLTQF